VRPPLTVAILVPLLAGCVAAPDETRGWHVSGGFIRDREGRAVILRGVNLAGAHKYRPYFGFHQQADVARVRTDWGMNALRLLVSWAALEPERGRYNVWYLDEVARRVEWAEAAGLAVVLDMHQDVYGEGFGGNGAPRWTCDEAHYAAHVPASPWFVNYTSPPVMACFDQLWTDVELQDHFAGAWRRLAERLVAYPAVVGFDVINEPHWGSHNVHAFEAERLGPFYERVVAAVRQAAPRWVAFLEPASSRNLGIPTGLQRPTVDDVVYAPHSYDASAEQGQGFDPARREDLLANLAALAQEARALGAPLWIGEYGGIADHPHITEYMDAQYDGAAAAAAGTMVWAYDRSDGYGLLRPDGSEKQELLDALVRPYPARVAGDPVSYDFDEVSRTFTLVYLPDPGSRAPTEIVVPARVYPHGYQLLCDGCRHEAGPDRVRLTLPPRGSVATVSVAPP
jgi:endoglycosylceramidase